MKTKTTFVTTSYPKYFALILLIVITGVALAYQMPFKEITPTLPHADTIEVVLGMSWLAVLGLIFRLSSQREKKFLLIGLVFYLAVTINFAYSLSGVPYKKFGANSASYKAEGFDLVNRTVVLTLERLPFFYLFPFIFAFETVSLTRDPTDAAGFR
jgi:predicted membrane channel-forming protein YqfA (hemolysin III family)